MGGPSHLCRLADEDLMPRVAALDADALEVLFDRHARAAFSLAYRICGSRTDADDVVQEAFLSVWRSAARYDPALGSVRSWTLTIVHNRALDQIRRMSRHEGRQMYDDGLAERLRAPDDTEADVLARSDAEDMQGILGTLSAEQARVIEMAFYGGFTHAQIADALALPLGTVKGRMRLGMEKLAVVIAGAGT